MCYQQWKAFISVILTICIVSLGCLFCHSGCGNCKIAKPQFEDAAMKLLKENNKKFAAVDCSKETG